MRSPGAAAGRAGRGPYGEVQARAQEAELGQASLFGGGEAGVERPTPKLPTIPEWSEQDRLAREKEALGFFISGHPLDRYREVVRGLRHVQHGHVEGTHGRAGGSWPVW